MTSSVNRRYLPEIDQLRAFAALLVLCYHGLQLLSSELAHGTHFNWRSDWLRPSDPINPRLASVDAKVSVNSSLAEALDAVKAQNGP